MEDQSRPVASILANIRIPQPTAEAPAAQEAEVCPVCKGAGWLRIEAPVGHPSFGRSFKCECLSNRIESEKFEELGRLSAVDAVRDKTFDTFDSELISDNINLRDVFQEARKFARDPSGWLILCGEYGRGKTHLAAAIANYALANRIKVLFTAVPDLLDHLRATFGPSSEIKYDELFENVRSTQLLILDDLGTENATPWAQEKIYQIFNYRYNFRLPTVITINLPSTTDANETETQRRDRLYAKLLNLLDGRIVSRLLDRELSKVIEIRAGDYRKKVPSDRKKLRNRRR